MFDLPKIRPEAVAAMRAPKIKPKATRDSVADLFKNEDAQGAALFVAASKVLGPIDEWIDWHPATTRLELQDALGLKKIDDDIFGRLVATTSILANDLFYQDLSAFIEIANVLGGAPPLPGQFDPADVLEILSAVLTARFVDDESIEFSEEIRAYVGLMLAEEGFAQAPGMLSFAIPPDEQYDLQDAFEDADMLGGVIESQRLMQEGLETFQREEMKELIAQLASVGVELPDAESLRE